MTRRSLARLSDTKLLSVFRALVNIEKCNARGRIRYKTHRQVETIVAEYKPPVVCRDRVKPVRVTVSHMGQNAKNRSRKTSPLAPHRKATGRSVPGHGGLHGQAG